MRTRHLAMGAALLVAAGIAVFGDKTPASAVAEAVVRPARPVASLAPAAPKAVADALILRLLPRGELIGDSKDVLGSSDNVFRSHNWTPPPPPPPPPPPAAAPPPPSAPPLPFTYIGKAVGEGAWEVFLARADKTYIVRNKTVVDGVYRIDAISPPTMTITYLPLNQVQQLNIGVLD